MNNFECKICKKQWPENYCPECGTTIYRSAICADGKSTQQIKPAKTEPNPPEVGSDLHKVRQSHNWVWLQEPLKTLLQFASLTFAVIGLMLAAGHISQSSSVENVPLIFHGIERIIIAIGGIGFGAFGYRLFVRGISQGKGKLQFKSPVAKIVFSGTGPGLFFMAFGAIVLLIALLKGSVQETIFDKLLNKVVEIHYQSKPPTPQESNLLVSAVLPYPFRCIHEKPNHDSLRLGFVGTNQTVDVMPQQSISEGGYIWYYVRASTPQVTPELHDDRFPNYHMPLTVQTNYLEGWLATEDKVKP